MNTTPAEEIHLTLHGLPDSRREVYHQLSDDEQTALELTDRTPHAKATVYQSLQDLRAEGLATCRLKIRIGVENVHVWTRGEL